MHTKIEDDIQDAIHFISVDELILSVFIASLNYARHTRESIWYGSYMLFSNLLMIERINLL